MSPKPDVSEERRSQIIEAAMAVFSKKGFHEARMDDIVDEAGLSKGALYWYFKSKDEIIQSILDRMFEVELGVINQVAASEGSSIDQLRRLIELVIADVTRLKRFLPILYEFIALAFRHKTVQAVMKGYLRSYTQALIPLLQKGMDQGELRRTDPQEAALAIAAMVEGTILLWVYDPETVQLDQHLRSSMETLLQGLQASTVR